MNRKFASLLRPSLTATLLLVVSSFASVFAQTAAPTQVLFSNVRVFDGKSATLSAPSYVLVRGNKIEKISTTGIPVDRSAMTKVIEGNGRTLMPGLIDMHWHVIYASIPLSTIVNGDMAYVHLVAGKAADETLMRGFTSVRDVGGPAFALKRAIDEGVVNGPRVWPSGAMISQTGGHGDFRMLNQVPEPRNAPPPRGEAINGGVIADSPDEVRKRVREQLMLGASQIKLAAGGGVASDYDPIDVSQYTEAEFRAAVEATENWGTYVTVHAYTPRAIRMAIAGGVKCIEHGQLMDEATAKLMADKGVWLSIQPFLDNEFANPQATPAANARALQVYAGTDNAYKLAKKYKIKTAWGTDILFDPKATLNQGAQLATLTRWYTSAELLKMATGANAELLAVSGPRNPYPGKLGVIEEGALADLILVNGDPIADIKLIVDPTKNFVVIMKDGKIYKDTLR